MSPPHSPTEPATGRVGVSPGAVLEANRGFFEALEIVFPVRFEPRATGDTRGLDGALMIGDSAEPPACRCLIATPGTTQQELADGQGSGVRFGSSPALDPCLRGALLHDVRAASLSPLAVQPGDEVLAEGPNGPVWTRRGEDERQVHRVALSPAQHDSSLPLRAQLRAGQFLSMLPLAVFLRELTEPHQWTRPPLRASFVMDDPNLRWPTYGFVDFRSLASHATEHGYHVTVAPVPLDSWPVSRSAARAFVEFPGSLSLCIHGLAHRRHELERFRSVAEARRGLALALRRVAILERRAGIRVDRVMAAPHERCSAVTTEAMLQLGFEALVIDRANPWRFRPEQEKPVAGWDLAELVSGGLPVIRRESLSASREDLILRAFLGQPLVLYGHHDDLSEGPEVLATIADEVNRLGDLRWTSLGEIARTNYLLGRTGSLLTVRMLCRRVHLQVPKGVSEIAVELPGVRSAADGTIRCGDSLVSFGSDGSIFRSHPVPVDGGTIDIELTRPRARPALARTLPTSTAWALVRRAIAEGRDRMQPLEHRMRQGAL